MSERILKINEQISHDLSLLIERELTLKPGVFITVTRVDTTRDLRYTRVFVSVYPEKEANYALETLNHEKQHLQKLLHQHLVMKLKPRISFEYDATEVAAGLVEQLLKKVAEERLKE